MLGCPSVSRVEVELEELVRRIYSLQQVIRRVALRSAARLLEIGMRADFFFWKIELLHDLGGFSFEGDLRVFHIIAVFLEAS